MGIVNVSKSVAQAGADAEARAADHTGIREEPRRDQEWGDRNHIKNQQVG